MPTLDHVDPTRVLLVDDHLLMRQVLELVLDSEPDLAVVGTTPDAETALGILGSLLPQVVLMDLDLPGMSGIEATRQVALHHPLVRVVVLSASCTRSLVAAALDAGAWGYLLKEEPVDRLLAGIRAVCDGERTLAAPARALLDA